MTTLKRLARCGAGAAILEFALLAPVFLMMLFGIIEFSRLAWTRQTLDEVAFSTARCMSVETSCGTTDMQRSYAISRAADYGIALSAANVTISGNASCNGYGASNTVTISKSFASPAKGLIPALPDEVTSSACFPVLG